LKYYCSKTVSDGESAASLPSCQARLVGGSLVVVSRHKYARIAKELAVPRIRVVVSNDAADDLVQWLVQDNIKVVDLEVIKQEEMKTVVHDAWHVFFFGSPLNKEGQDAFRADIAGFFLRSGTDYPMNTKSHVSHLAFPFDRTCGEFVARTSAGDPSWVSNFWQICHTFSQEVSTIVSYQGRRFGD